MKRSFYIVFFLLFSASVYGQLNIDSLNSLLKNLPERKKNNPEDTTECQLLFQLAYSSTADEDQAQLYRVRLKDQSEKHLKELPADHPLRRTFYYYLSFAYNDIGLYYRNIGDVSRALEYLHMCLKLDEASNEKDQLGVDYNNIALVYYDIGDKDKALEYFEKSLSYVEKTDDKRGNAYSLLNVGFIYYTKNDIKKAFACFNKSLQLAKEIGNLEIESKAFNNKGLLYAKEGDYKQAMEHHSKALEISEKLKDDSGIASALSNISSCYKLQNNYAEAKKYAAKALKMFQGLESVEGIRKAAFLLKESNEKLGDYREALKMYDLYIQMRDSTNNTNTRKMGLKKQFEYEYDKKEIQLKEEQERLKKLYDQKQKFYLVLSLVLIILFIILLISFYFRYRFKQEKESKDLHIELKERLKQEIREKESIANSLIHTQEQEREKLAAELHDGVNQLLFAAKIQLQASKSVDENMHKDAVKLVESAINEIKSIASNQGSFLLNNKSLKDALSDLILQMKGNKKLEITFLNYGLDETELDQNQKTNILRIIQELLNNALKHSEARNCYLSIKTARNRVLFSVTDNGTGFDLNTVKSGNGLKNISNKVTLMKGVKKVFSIRNSGSKVHIEIPIS